MIKYITDVTQKDKTTFILDVNGKSLSVNYEEERPCSYDKNRIEPATYIYGNVTVYDDLTVCASKAHLAEIVLAIEVVKVIKENT